MEAVGNNYTVTLSTAVGTITPASLTINAVTDTKVYDATTGSGGAPMVSGLLGGDAVSGATQAYVSKNVLGTNGSTLQVTAYTVNDGNSGNNYTVTTNTAAGTITPALLTLNAITDTKVYDATTTSSAVPTVSGLQGADSVGGRVQAYASKNVLGTNGSTLQVTAYTVNDGNSGNNYTVSTSTAAGTITPASLTVNAVSDTKVYDATTSSTGVPTAGGLQGADTVSGQAQAYASKNVLGTNGSTLQVTAYTVNDGNLGNNYAVTTNTAAGTITPKALTGVSLTGTVSKTYDGNASATLIPSNYTISGFVAGEGATITNTVGSYGNGKDVQGPAALVSSAVLTSGDYSAASGTLLSNYDLSAVTGVVATGNIGQITRLGSVSAISNGLWSSASTWQGGAIPDKANVANVNLNGFAVTFDNSVGTNAGVTNLDSLTGGVAGSKLTFSSSNQLQVLNALNVQGYAQTAGTVATGTTFTVTNNFNQTGGTINSGAAVNITQASGGLNAFGIAGSGTLILTANNATGDIVLGSGAGLSGTTVTLTAGRNVSLSAPVSGSTAVNVSFGQQVAGTFTPTAIISGTTTVTGGAGADTFDLSGAPSITATLAGGAGSDTLRQSGGKTWTLNNATANAGSSGGLTWSAIENLTDTGAGAFNMGTSGSLSGTISAASGSINYASHAGPVTFNLNGGASTGMASWNGITNVAGSTGNDAITGMSQTYTVTGSNAGSNGTVTWNSFENLTDLGTGTLRATSATWTLNGSNTGTVTNLSGTFAGMGNLTDLRYRHVQHAWHRRWLDHRQSKRRYERYAELRGIQHERHNKSLRCLDRRGWDPQRHHFRDRQFER